MYILAQILTCGMTQCTQPLRGYRSSVRGYPQQVIEVVIPVDVHCTCPTCS